jgi:hypothetical protein
VRRGLPPPPALASQEYSKDVEDSTYQHGLEEGAHPRWVERLRSAFAARYSPWVVQFQIKQPQVIRKFFAQTAIHREGEARFGLANCVGGRRPGSHRARSSQRYDGL